MTGFVYLHRSILDSEWFADYKTNHLFIYCILRANHERTFWKGIQLQRGQFLTSYKNLSENTGLTVQQIRTSIKKLKSTSNITSKTTNKYQIITITNYDLYQGINKQPNKQVTNKQQTSNKQVTTDNKHNKHNTLKEDIYSQFENLWKNYNNIHTLKGSKQKAKQKYIKFINEGVSHEEIIRGLTNYMQYAHSTGAYTQHVSVWLNQRGWENEYTTTEKAIERKADKQSDATNQWIDAYARAASQFE